MKTLCHRFSVLNIDFNVSAQTTTPPRVTVADNERSQSGEFQC